MKSLKEKIDKKFKFVCNNCLTEKNTYLKVENIDEADKLYIVCRICKSKTLINMVYR